jgi:hypothetical protein
MSIFAEDNSSHVILRRPRTRVIAFRYRFVLDLSMIDLSSTSSMALKTPDTFPKNLSLEVQMPSTSGLSIPAVA